MQPMVLVYRNLHDWVIYGVVMLVNLPYMEHMAVTGDMVIMVLSQWKESQVRQGKVAHPRPAKPEIKLEQQDPTKNTYLCSDNM